VNPPALVFLPWPATCGHSEWVQAWRGRWRVSASTGVVDGAARASMKGRPRRDGDARSPAAPSAV